MVAGGPRGGRQASQAVADVKIGAHMFSGIGEKQTRGMVRARGGGEGTAKRVANAIAEEPLQQFSKDNPRTGHRIHDGTLPGRGGVDFQIVLIERRKIPTGYDMHVVARRM